LFSNDNVAAFIGQNFEPVWEMVREVPIIRIDFGGGNVLTRTLHGNILTSVCTADGRMLDALPGIYEPATYIDQLDEFRLLAQIFNRQPANTRDGWVRKYHEAAVAAIKAGQPPARFLETKRFVPIGKGMIEQPTEAILARGGQPRNPLGQPVPPKGAPVGPIPKSIIERPTEKVIVLPAPPAPVLAKTPISGDAAELARWTALMEDTKLNETTRRRQIHEMLAKEGPVAPAKVLKPIYKDVLHADLDDPYLGLGPTLFENYPFAKEDALP
jgi:hypothetical protein